MHSWDIMPQSANYEQAWCGATTTSSGSTHIKIEPQTNETTFDSIDMKTNNNNTMILGTGVSQRNSESNPTSPHSIGSDESVVNHPSLYYNDTLHSLINGNRTHQPLGFNPLTPPGYPLPNCLRTADINVQEPRLPTTPSRRKAFPKTETTFNSTSLTPIHTPPMDQTPPKSPKFRSDVSEKDCTDLENGSISGDDTKSLCSDYNQEISLPKVNSHGKVKTHKCKHCSFVGVTKKEFWEHTRQHIKPEKQISCSKCPFVTEFKHHYEYHLRNHEGQKPFKCPECTYSCVNKSMLNSHLKSHSDVYQYRCENCNYATKYVHSLKLHLRKYEHQPAIPLDSEGVPDSTPVIDIYGTRRGPKKRHNKTSGKREAKKQNKGLKSKESSPQKVQLPQLQSNQSPTTSHHQQQQQQPQQPPPQTLSNMLPPFLPNHIANMLPYFNLQMFAAQQQVLAAAQLSPNHFRNGGRNFENIDCDEDDDVNMINGRMNDINNEMEMNHPESPTSSVPNSNPSLNNSHMSKIGDDDNRSSPIDCHASKHHSHLTSGRCSEVEKSPDNGTTTSSNTQKMYDCKFCGILFRDVVLHTIHMGYHGYNDVFTCNMCGEKCTDRISFFLHIAKNQHS